jgi:flagellar hook-length control protein FliK
MMNLMLNTVNPAPAAAPAAGAAAANSAPADAVPAGGAAAPASAALPFAQWLGQQDDPVLAADAAAVADDGAAPGAVADAPAQDDTAAATADGAAAPAPANPLLAAMAMPLIAVALPIAAAQQLAPSKDGTAGPRATPAITATSTISSTAASAAAGAGPDRSMRVDAPTGLAAAPMQAQAVDNGTGAAALPAAPALNSSAAESAPPAAAPARPALAANAGSTAPDGSSAASAPQGAAGAAPWGVSAPAAPQQGAPAGTVTLAGPPAAWRQTLHEALGERLHLQLGNNMEQAVIRLEPPMLGRVEIAIRHAAGSLEVTLSATHGEVLRQLQTVSENLRNDLAQRQFTEVAVTVAPAPRSAAANPFAGDQQGRGRQHGRQQEDNTPGLALNDAGNPSSTFSLNGRA